MPSTLSCITGGQTKPKVFSTFSSISVVPQMLEVTIKKKTKSQSVDKRQERRHVIISIFNGVLNPRTSFISSLGHEDKTWPSFNWFITCVKGEGGEDEEAGNEARCCSDR